MDNKPRISVVYKCPGEAASDTTMLESMYHECMTGIVLETEWLDCMRKSIEALPRYELCITVAGKVVGAAVFAEDWDMHVGSCMSLMMQYILPEHRGAGLERGIISALKYLAKSNGVDYIALARRITNTEFKVRYVWVKS